MKTALEILYKTKEKCEANIDSLEKMILNQQRNLKQLSQDLSHAKIALVDIQEAIIKLEGKDASKSKKTKS